MSKKRYALEIKSCNQCGYMNIRYKCKHPKGSEVKINPTLVKEMVPPTCPLESRGDEDEQGSEIGGVD